MTGNFPLEDVRAKAGMGEASPFLRGAVVVALNYVNNESLVSPTRSVPMMKIKVLRLSFFSFPVKIMIDE